MFIKKNKRNSNLKTKNFFLINFTHFYFIINLKEKN